MRLSIFVAAVGPVILTIPSYFTFTIAQRTGEVNVTMTDPDEAMEALRANLPNVWTTADNLTWTTTNITKYYMHFSDLAKERDNLLFRLINNNLLYALFCHFPEHEKKFFSYRSRKIIFLTLY